MAKATAPGGAGLPPAGWEASLLQQIGAPDTTANRQFFDVWAAEEHGGSTPAWGGVNQGGAFNPFDTGLPEPGSSNYNNLGGGFGVQNYADWKSGAAATTDTLEQSNMSPLLDALRSGASSVTDLEGAEGQTPWGQASSWPAAGVTVPTSTSGTGVSTIANTAAAGATTPASSTGSAQPWGGAFGSQIEEGVFFLLGIALVITGLIIMFGHGGDDTNPAPPPSPAGDAAKAMAVA